MFLLSISGVLVFGAVKTYIYPDHQSGVYDPNTCLMQRLRFYRQDGFRVFLIQLLMLAVASVISGTVMGRTLKSWAQQQAEYLR